MEEFPFRLVTIFAIIGTIIFYLSISWLQKNPLKGIFEKEWKRNKKFYDWMLRHKWSFPVFTVFLILFRYVLWEFVGI